MTIIEIIPLDNGAHRNQTTRGPIPLPDGWALVPDDMLPLENYPFGEAVVDDISGIPTVTGWTPLPIPESPPDPDPQPTEFDHLRADVDFHAALDGVEL